MYDLMILGGGPAGMTAAVYAARKRLGTLLISKDIGGQPNLTASVENYMGYQFVEGPELMHKFEEQVKQFPIDMKVGDEIQGFSRLERGFEARTDKGEAYQAKAVIIATGKRPRQLNVPGELEFRGKGVTYCSICDGPLFAGMNVAVIGGGNSALGSADDMVKVANQVYIVSLTPFTGDQILIDKVKSAENLSAFTEHQVVKITGNDFVEGMEIRSLKTGRRRKLQVRGVFIEIGLIPNSEPFKGVVPLNRLGEIDVDCANGTGVPGLFAAGDVTNVPEKQIVVAAGEGAKAALQAHRYLQMLRG